MTGDTHRHFHDELGHVKVRLLTMSGEAEAALGLAVDSLLERNRDKARQVIAGDRIVDAMEVEIEEMCINLLALQQPMARDLRMLTSALKIASDLEKPDALVVVDPDRVQEFLDPLPVGRIWGVGRVTGSALERIGVATIADLRRLPPEQLRQHFGSQGDHFWKLAHGIDNRPVVAEHELTPPHLPQHRADVLELGRGDPGDAVGVEAVLLARDQGA